MVINRFSHCHHCFYFGLDLHEIDLPKKAQYGKVVLRDFLAVKGVGVDSYLCIRYNWIVSLSKHNNYKEISNGSRKI